METTEHRSVTWRIHRCLAIGKEAKGTSDGWKNLYSATDTWEKEVAWWTVNSFSEQICQNLRGSGKRWGWKGGQEPNHKGPLCPSKVLSLQILKCYKQRRSKVPQKGASPEIRKIGESFKLQGRKKQRSAKWSSKNGLKRFSGSRILGLLINNRIWKVRGRIPAFCLEHVPGLDWRENLKEVNIWR